MDGEIMTVEDITRIQADDADRLERAQEQLTQARQSHDHLVARYGDDQSATAMAVRAEQDAALAAVEREVGGMAEAVRRNSAQALRQFERAAGPTLNAEETQRAAHLREEIREDAERLDAAALRDRMVAALTTGDRAAMHHLARYVPLRDFGPGTGAAGETQALGEIPALIGRMKEALRSRALDPHLERTRALLGKATDVHTAATQRRRQQEAEQAAFVIRGMVRGVPVPTDEELIAGASR